MSDSARVDVWLWSVRVFPTRSAAKEACVAGRVRVDDDIAKPATKVTVGNRVTTRRGTRVIDVEVVRPITKRVGAAIAADCLIDHSPPPPDPIAAADVRDRGTGRPTKRDRREIERLKRRR